MTPTSQEHHMTTSDTEPTLPGVELRDEETDRG